MSMQAVVLECRVVERHGATDSIAVNLKGADNVLLDLVTEKLG